MVDANSGDSGSGMRDRKMNKEVLESDALSGNYVSVLTASRDTSQLQGNSSVMVHGMFSIHGADS